MKNVLHFFKISSKHHVGHIVYVFNIRIISDSFPWSRTYNSAMNIFEFNSVAQLCPTLCDLMNHSTPGLPVHHQLPESTQTHVHWVDDAMLCCPLLLLPSIPPNIKVFSNESTLHIRWPKYWSFSLSISPSNEHHSPLEWTGWISLQSKGLSRVFSNTTVQKLQFFGVQVSS